MRRGRRTDGKVVRALFGAGSVLALSLGVFFMSRNTERSPSLLGTTANAPGVAVQARPSGAPSGVSAGGGAADAGNSGKTAAPGSGATLAELAPTSSRIREESARDPGRTPESLVRFSQEVRARTDRALRNDEAEPLFGELERCVSAPDVSPQAQVICVSNADRLAEESSALAIRVRALHAVMSPEARSVLDSYHGMKKAPAR